MCMWMWVAENVSLRHVGSQSLWVYCCRIHLGGNPSHRAAITRGDARLRRRTLGLVGLVGLGGLGGRSQCSWIRETKTHPFGDIKLGA